MTNYRRDRLDGESYFFTVNLAKRQRSLLTERIDSLRNAFRVVKNTHPFMIDAVIVLPEHLHTIGTLLQGLYNS
jgi:putative transposase